MPIRSFILILLCLASSVFVSVDAKERVAGMKQKVYEALTQAQTFIEAKNYAEALSVLEKAKSRKKITPYERAHMLNMMGAIHQQNEHYGEALAHYELAIAQEDLPFGLRKSILTRMAQLHMIQDQYVEALKYAKLIIKESEEPDAGAHILAAQASYYVEDFINARNYAEEALRLDTTVDKPPREAWMMLANAIYFAMKDYDKMISFQFEILKHYPRDRYLLNLAAIYGELEHTEKQLALVEAVHEGGYIKDGNKLSSLTSLLMLHENPYKSAVILEKAIKDGKVEENERNLEKLGQAWSLSGELEKAIPPLISAAKLSQDGNLYARVASAYIGLAQWKKVVEHLDLAIKKGYLHNMGGAYLSKGMAEFRLKRYDDAEKSFTEAKAYPKSKKLSEQWLMYMESELQKMAALKEA